MAEVLLLDRDRNGDILTCEFVQKHSLILRLIQGFVLPGRLRCMGSVCVAPYNAEHQYKLLSCVPINGTVPRNVATFDCTPIRDRMQFCALLTVIALLVLSFVFSLRLHLHIAKYLGLGSAREKQQ
jgi:hypothetical protein